jgi:hypothetical protein
MKGNKLVKTNTVKTNTVKTNRKKHLKKFKRTLKLALTSKIKSNNILNDYSKIHPASIMINNKNI